MKSPTKKYETYVEHPRFGRGPRVTGLDPDPLDPKVHLHWNSISGFSGIPQAKRIPNTAVAADLTRQAPATVAVTHYFDLDRVCRDCGRAFIFFAEEQKHWYEELGFGLDSDCVRCVECRKRQQGIDRHRARYEELFHLTTRTEQEKLEMAECCLALIESSAFTRQRLQHVRMLLKQLRPGGDEAIKAQCDHLRDRVRAIESQSGQ